MTTLYEVHDLGANEVIATFRDKRDADAWSLTKSIDGPALQVRPAKAKTPPLLPWVKDAAIGATKLLDTFDAFNTLRQLTALDHRVAVMPEVVDWCRKNCRSVVAMC